MSNDDSFVSVSKSATTFVGPDATMLFSATTLRGAIQFYVKTRMKVSRLHTPTAMLATASRITGKPYKRTELAKAAADLTAWIDAMKAALPVIDEREAGR